MPQEQVKKEFPEPVEGVSKMFVQIYNESNHAEQLGLSSIAGPGYRKALEFLIKDFLVFQNPKEKSTVAEIQKRQEHEKRLEILRELAAEEKKEEKDSEG